jgi:hypothetical protein
VSGNSYDVFCGNMSDLDPNTHTLQSSSSSVDITFVSNYLHEGQGFVIEYNSHIPCSNKTFTNTTGHIYSDNYPNSSDHIFVPLYHLHISLYSLNCIVFHVGKNYEQLLYKIFQK